MKDNRTNFVAKEQAKTKSISKGFLHSTKFKIIASIIGVIVVAAIGIGLGTGLTKETESKSHLQPISSLTTLKEKFENLPKNRIVISKETAAIPNWTLFIDNIYIDIMFVDVSLIVSDMEVQHQIQTL